MNTDNPLLMTALEQSAIDLGCKAEDFLKETNTVVLSRSDSRARKYLHLPQICSITSYGAGAVASIGEERYRDGVQNYLDRYPLGNLFETPTLYALNRLFEKDAAKACFMAEYFLPEGPSDEPPLSFRTGWLENSDFANLYCPEWSNALCESRKELDVLGIAAYDGERLIALAACSADCDTMWQIGIDVLPEYRGKGLSTALTIRLKNEILHRGKVPFYCAAWCNIRSVRNALSSGFKPAWVELSVKENSTVEKYL